jgi:hypothetical protein
MEMDTKDNRLSDKVDYAVGDCHDDTALLRRIDWRILPVMFLTYFLQFVDKISLNVRSASPFLTHYSAGCWLC